MRPFGRAARGLLPGPLRASIALLVAAACSPGPDPAARSPAPPSAPAAASIAAHAASSHAASSPALPPPAPPRPAPACPESGQEPGPFARGIEPARVVAGAPHALGRVEQAIGVGAPVELRFLGGHLFDLLGKVDQEGGAREVDQRRLICAALGAAARTGAPVVRLWGSLKRTGTDAEVARSAELLALLVDENARRDRPLRLVITLLNHQPGYGSPDPSRALDDLPAESPWNARRVYLGESWRMPGQGLLAQRIEALRARRALVEAPEILGWELVNELDTHRVIRSPEEARVFRERFVGPALALLAESFPQPILLGDLRAPRASYDALGGAILDGLPASVRARLVWTSHVYAPRVPAASPEMAAATWKLDRDLALASERGMPFLLGELGQLAPGPSAGFCQDGPRHDLAPLFTGVLDPPGGPALRRQISMALFWGEGHCALPVPGDQGTRLVSVGAGGDAADLGPGERAAREQVREARLLPRFRAP